MRHVRFAAMAEGFMRETVASQQNGGLRPCFGQLDARAELDLRASMFGGSCSLSAETVGHAWSFASRGVTRTEVQVEYP